MPEPVAESNPGNADLKAKVQSLRIPAGPQRRSGSRFAWVLVLLLLGANGYTGYRVYQLQAAAEKAAQEYADATTTQTPQSPASKGAASLTLDSTASATSGTVPTPGAIALESRGYIMPTKQILVSPKVSGMIIKLDIAEGKRVAKGDVLAVIESTEYQSEFDRQTALLNAAQQRLLELESGTHHRNQEIESSAHLIFPLHCFYKLSNQKFANCGKHF